VPASPPVELDAAGSIFDGSDFDGSDFDGSDFDGSDFDASSPESRFAAELLARRSTFAQPEPLNTTVGGANALRTGPPPQLGQVSGPWPWTPCTTSKRCPQAAHV
jgi:hypothetical protein